MGDRRPQIGLGAFGVTDTLKSISFRGRRSQYQTEPAPIPTNHPIIPKWGRICHEMLRHLDIGNWSSITCWQYGAETDQSQNPTLIVNLTDEAVGSFLTAARRIRGVLAFLSVDNVDILFMKNEQSRGYSGGFDDTC